MNIPHPWPVVLALSATLSLAPPAWADEGMWTFNNFPSAQVKAKYGFAPDAAWLDRLRLASVRIAGGCSASIVSASGLVMTNHHCARSCIDSVAAKDKKDYGRDGFFARTAADEANCAGVELNQLVEITDVTQRVQAATQGLPAERFADARKAVIAETEKQCAISDEFRCEVVNLYRGGRYDLYRYRRLQDIRLVFAPEDAIAFFGGDPDNFMFPRYDLDVTFLRIYGRDGRPLSTPDHLVWSDSQLREGDLSFVSGHPGGTSRSLTMAQMADERDHVLPWRLAWSAELRGYLTGYQHRGAEQKRHSNDQLFGIENWLKSLKGQQAALADAAFYAQLADAERDFRARVAADPELQRLYGDTWDRIAALTAQQRALRRPHAVLELGIRSRLFGFARRLVRHGEELGKPNGERLAEYTDARLPALKQAVLSQVPVYRELDEATLAWSLTRLREELGPDHPVVKRVLGQRSPQSVAATAVRGSKLDDIRVDRSGRAVGGYRKSLFDGGKAAIDASKDPMIELVRSFDADARAVRKQIETEVEGPLLQQQERLARARFAVYGEGRYPDATFTLRLSYGTVKGYEENGRRVAPFTTLAGAFERHTGADPFALPPSWLAARTRLGGAVPMNFVTDNDIIGGNSGSPVVNQRGEVVGLVFDGNIQSLGGDYGFDAAVNRTVAVHSAAIIEALDKVYGARRLLQELNPRSSSAARQSGGAVARQP